MHRGRCQARAAEDGAPPASLRIYTSPLVHLRPTPPVLQVWKENEEWRAEQRRLRDEAEQTRQGQQQAARQLAAGGA